MIEILKENYIFKTNQTALKINRHKKRGHTIVGIGYPFYYNEFFGLIKLCDFFIDDVLSISVNGWKKRFNIKNYEDIALDEKYVILLFSPNGLSVFEKIKGTITILEIIKIFDDSEMLKTLSDIERSEMLTYRTTEKDNIIISNALIVKGNCEITNNSKSAMKISFLEMHDKSSIKNNSRFNSLFDSLYLCENASLQLTLDGQVDIRNCFINNNTKINVYSGALKMEDTYIGSNCIIHVYNNVTIGSGSIISWNVSIMDGDGHSIYYDDRDNRPQKIIIEDNVWIGSNAIVLKGVTIGKGSIVAAGSVIASSVPPHSLVAGNPAKVIKNNIKWEYKYHFDKETK